MTATVIGPVRLLGFAGGVTVPAPAAALKLALATVELPLAPVATRHRDIATWVLPHPYAAHAAGGCPAAGHCTAAAAAAAANTARGPAARARWARFVAVCAPRPIPRIMPGARIGAPRAW